MSKSFLFNGETFVIDGYSKECTTNCGLIDISHLSLTGPIASREMFVEIVNSDQFVNAFRAKFGIKSAVISDNLANDGSLNYYLKTAYDAKNRRANTGDIMGAIAAGKKWTYMCTPLFENPVHRGTSLLMVMFLISDPSYLHSNRILRNLPIDDKPPLAWTKNNFTSSIERIKARFKGLRVNVDGRFKTSSESTSSADGAGAAQPIAMPAVPGWS